MALGFCGGQLGFCERYQKFSIGLLLWPEVVWRFRIASFLTGVRVAEWGSRAKLWRGGC